VLFVLHCVRWIQQTHWESDEAMETGHLVAIVTSYCFPRTEAYISTVSDKRDKARVECVLRGYTCFPHAFLVNLHTLLTFIFIYWRYFVATTFLRFLKYFLLYYIEYSVHRNMFQTSRDSFETNFYAGLWVTSSDSWLLWPLSGSVLSLPVSLSLDLYFWPGTWMVTEYNKNQGTDIYTNFTRYGYRVCRSTHPSVSLYFSACIIST
jgi:hypothetical protein